MVAIRGILLTLIIGGVGLTAKGIDFYARYFQKYEMNPYPITYGKPLSYLPLSELQMLDGIFYLSNKIEKFTQLNPITYAFSSSRTDVDSLKKNYVKKGDQINIILVLDQSIEMQEFFDFINDFGKDFMRMKVFLVDEKGKLLETAFINEGLKRKQLRELGVIVCGVTNHYFSLLINGAGDILFEDKFIKNDLIPTLTTHFLHNLDESERDECWSCPKRNFHSVHYLEKRLLQLKKLTDKAPFIADQISKTEQQIQLTKKFGKVPTLRSPVLLVVSLANTHVSSKFWDILDQMNSAKFQAMENYANTHFEHSLAAIYSHQMEDHITYLEWVFKNTISINYGEDSFALSEAPQPPLLYE